VNLFPRRLSSCFVFGVLVAVRVHAHPETMSGADLALADASRKNETAAPAPANSCVLHLRLEDATSHQPVGGMVRVTPLQDGAVPLALAGLFERPAGWFSTSSTAEIKLPPGRFQVEATRGTDTLVSRQVVECLAGTPRNVVLTLTRFYHPEARHVYSGNTHLHLLLHSGPKVGVELQDRRDTDDYLRTVGASDGLDLVYVSYLTAPGAKIISNEYTEEDLQGLSKGPTLFANGVEHRHGGVRVKVAPMERDGSVKRTKAYPLDSSVVSMTYGHVLLLDLAKRSMLASVGPGLSDNSRATDGVPLRDGINDARRQGGAIIWCHGSMGLEDIPDWIAGLIEAQNIYDGGSEGTFDTVYYPYLNAGLKVPFSTGTDWGITDFSRVYVPALSGFSSKIFLQQLTAGRSYITNEPFLEFEVGGSSSGDTLALAQPGTVHVRGRAFGRSDFTRLQVVSNGKVVHEVASRTVDGHYEAAVDLDLPVGESGWLALRIPPDRPYEYRSKYSGPGTNIFGKAIFAHTSPVYVSVAGQLVFNRSAVELLLTRLQDALKQIDKTGRFANEAERSGIRRIYTDAAASLQATLDARGRH
jgi:hypothetical protein